MPVGAAFKNENTRVGISPQSNVQIGISDQDVGTVLERGVLLPFPKDALSTYFYYNCWIECQLDSGIVTHRHLPQYNGDPDSLGTGDVADSAFPSATPGVNTISKDQFADFTQRMAHSVYRFCLRGQAIRVGLQVPIPKLLTVGGVDAVPDDDTPQVAFNKVASNIGGVPLFYAEWALWYTVAVPPRAMTVPPANLAAHIRGDQQLPSQGMQAPFSPVDDNAVPSIPLQIPLGP